jgi:uncharacterized membrane protein
MNLSTRKSKIRRQSERGATLILVAISITVLIGASGMAVDLGQAYTTTRSLQLVADNAALDAGRYLTVPETVSLPSPTNNLTVHANNSALQNKSAAGITITQGVWNPAGPTVWNPKSSAFCKATTPPSNNLACNAVQVIATSHTSRLFSHGSAVFSRTAYAETTPEASFSIGSYLLQYNSTQTLVLGSLLGLFGTSADLTAVGFGGMANSYVSIQQLIDASNGVLTPQNVMSASVTAANWDQWMSRAVSSQAALLNCTGSNQPAPCYASHDLVPFAATTGADSSVSMQLCQMVSINGSVCGTQLPQTALAANINVLQTMTTEAELANGNSAISVTTALGLGLPATLTLKLIQPPQVAYGPVGTSASTAQVIGSLALTVPVGLINETLTVPIAAASGTAQLTQLNCTANSLYKATFGNVNTTTSGPNSVTLNGTPIASMTVTGASGGLAFGASVVPPTASTVAAKTNPAWIGLTTAPTVVFGSQAGGLNLLVSGLLNTTLPPVLSPAMQALGLTLAGAAVADLSTSCVAVALVK